MNDQIYKDVMARLDALAQKLGVAATYLYALYLKQAKIDGWECLIVACFLFTTAEVLGVYAKRAYIKRSEDNKKCSIYESKYPVAAVIMTVIGSLCFVFAGIFVINAVDLLSNPQLWAFKELVSNVK